MASGAVFFLALLQPARPEDMAGKPRELNTVLFGSLDGGRSVFASAGVKRTLGSSLDRDGFVFMAGAGAGGEPEREPLADVSFRPTAQAHALLGYQWMLGRAALSVLAGPEFDAELEAPSAWRSARTRFGLRGQAELWAHPTPETLATATLIAGSAREHLWGRLSGGYAFWPGVFVGPEASLYLREDYREWRLGAHVTGLKWRSLNLRISAGYRRDSDDRGGAYFGLTGYVRL